MRILRTIIFFTLLAYSVLFCVENFQRISLTIPFIADIESIPLFMVIIACVIGGVLLGSLVSAAKDINYFFKKKTVVKENRHLKKKLDMLSAEKNIQDSIGADQP